MSIDNKIESEKEFSEEEIEKFGQHFKGLVGERQYDEARKFYSGLNIVSGKTMISDNHHRAIWNNGTWYNGTWYGGTHVNGYFNNGYWLEGYWSGGTFNNGYWLNGYWLNGEINNGHFVQGILKDVTYN